MTYLERVGVFNVKHSKYGARGDGVTDDTQAIQDALDAIAAAGGGILYFPEGDYALTQAKNNEPIFSLGASLDGLTIEGTGYGSRLFTNASHTGTPSTALFANSANGDNFGGTTAGAANLTIRNLRLDGSGGTYVGNSWGIVINGGTGHLIENIWAHGWSKSGIIIQSFAAAPDVECLVRGCRGYDQVVNGGQGFAVASKDLEAGSVKFMDCEASNNGLGATGSGFDISTGGATLLGCSGWGNKAQGIKTAGNDGQNVIMDGCDFSNNTASGAKGFVTNGTVGSVQVSNSRFDNNASAGVDIAHAGNFVFNNVSCTSNAGQGFHVSGGGPHVNIGNAHSSKNSNRGFLFASGYISAGALSTRSNGQEGVAVGSAAVFNAGIITSVDDSATDLNMAVRFIPGASAQTAYGVGMIIVDSPSSYLTNAVSIGGNVSDMVISAVRGGGWSAATISDSGTNTSLLTN